MDNIMNLLNIIDTSIKIVDVETIGTTKTITLEKELHPHNCPLCGAKMHSRGIKTRIAKHPMLQDGYNVVLKVRQRRWRCTSVNCNCDISDEFSFLSKSRRITNTTDLLVVNAFRDYSRTATEIARQYHISDHMALDIFERYVHMGRLPLPEILCVDEVYLDMDRHCKYVLVLQNFKTGEPVDLIISRRKETTEKYFRSIPLEERNQVKFVISDMYNPYINYCGDYFANAVSIVDSFHVTQWIIRKLDNYLRKLLKQYKARDLEAFNNLPENKKTTKYPPLSHEVYLLQNHRWVLLKNQSKINYTAPARKDHHYGRMLDSYAIEALFFALAPDLEPLRALKEEYILFNSTYYEDPSFAAVALDQLISRYENCPHAIFNDFAETLKRYRPYILNSFSYAKRVKNGKSYDSRLSNGPMESLNRKAKDLKRNGRGYTNFDHLRNRFLFATRKDPALSPK